MYASSPVPFGALTIALGLLSKTLAFSEIFLRVVGLADVMPMLIRSVEISICCFCKLSTDVLGRVGELLMEGTDILASWNFLIYIIPFAGYFF
jgi:hypothetical protein